MCAAIFASPKEDMPTLKKNSELTQELNFWLCKKEACAQALILEIKKRKREEIPMCRDLYYLTQQKVANCAIIQSALESSSDSVARPVTRSLALKKKQRRNKYLY